MDGFCFLPSMKFTTFPVLAASLTLLCSCSSFSYRFPWQSKVAPGHPVLSGTDSADDVSKAPPLLELAEAGLDPVSKKEIDQCFIKLDLAEEVDQIADKTNFGERNLLDFWNRSLQAEPMLIVLHETVVGEEATLSLFQTPHPNDADQASYHMVIARDGRRLRIVPDHNRAYGAGMSAFGDVTQRIKPSSVGSVNNIALHISIVSPEDGRGDRSGHSGYTKAQYRNLAAQVLLWQAKFGIPLTRLTTHQAIDRSHSRYDPRSFRWDRFDFEYKTAARLCGFERFDKGTAGL